MLIHILMITFVSLEPLHLESERDLNSNHSGRLVAEEASPDEGKSGLRHLDRQDNYHM